MRSGGSGPKGAAWERHCCKQLSLRFTGGTRDDTMWRSAISGGRATFQLKQDIVNRAQAGDITAISAEAFALCERHLFECKAYQNLGFTALVTSGTGLLAGFWRKTQVLAERLGKHPVLIAKQNHYPAVVLTPIGCGLFASPWATLHGLEAELYWFEAATAVQPPTMIRRPTGSQPDVQSAPQIVSGGMAPRRKAGTAESTERSERAADRKSTVDIERAVDPESTVIVERTEP